MISAISRNSAPRKRMLGKACFRVSSSPKRTGGPALRVPRVRLRERVAGSQRRWEAVFGFPAVGRRSRATWRRGVTGRIHVDSRIGGDRILPPLLGRKPASEYATAYL